MSIVLVQANLQPELFFILVEDHPRTQQLKHLGELVFFQIWLLDILMQEARLKLLASSTILEDVHDAS